MNLHENKNEQNESLSSSFIITFFLKKNIQKLLNH